MNNDVYELIAHLCNEDPEEEEYILINALYDHYEIDINNFINLINDLLPLCYIEKSSLTDKLYQGFGTDKIWLFRREIK